MACVASGNDFGEVLHLYAEIRHFQIAHAARLLQLLRSPDKIFGLGTGGAQQSVRHFCHSRSVNLLFGAVGKVSPAQQGQAAAVHQVMIHAGQRMLQGMLKGQTAHGQAEACQGAGKRHFGSGFYIAAVGYGTGQILAHPGENFRNENIGKGHGLGA